MQFFTYKSIQPTKDKQNRQILEAFNRQQQKKDSASIKLIRFQNVISKHPNFASSGPNKYVRTTKKRFIINSHYIRKKNDFFTRSLKPQLPL